MAAFEAISRVTIRPLNRVSFIDFRTARLPYDRPEVDDFDPRDYREPKSPIKLWMAYFNLLRTVFGAGVLGLPLAISQAGIVLGPIMTVATGFLITHTHLMLLNCLNEISRQLKIPYISYRYGFRLAILHGPPCLSFIGNHGPCIIATFMFLSQVGICTVFVVFTSDSLRDIMDWPNSKPALLSLLLPYLLLEFFMKTLKVVSYVSMFGNFLNLIGLGLIMYLVFNDPHGDMVVAKVDPLPLLFGFGTFLFNLSAVGVVLSIDKALTQPKIMTKRFGIITIGIMVPTLVATVFGSLGYWSFGVMEENILRSLPFDDLISMAAIGLYLIAVAFAFPIQCYPGIQMVVEVIKNRNVLEAPSDNTLWLVETIARPLFVVISFFISYLIPFQGPFVAFVGNLCTTLLALVFPALMEICLLYPNHYGRYNVYLIKDLAIITLGLTSWIFGVVLCGNLIYIRIMASLSPHDEEFL